MATAGRGVATPVTGPTGAGESTLGNTGMTAQSLPPPGSPAPTGIEAHLFAEPFAYDFFQAVLILESLDRRRTPVGRGGPPKNEAARFRAHVSLNFPPSPIYDLQRGLPGVPPALTVAFLGLHGPSGVLPRHYTELLMKLEKEVKDKEKDKEKVALREWLDLFNHRFISLFFRAWEKYRFWVPYTRGEYTRQDTDPFTLALLSYVGLGTPRLRNRLQVTVWEDQTGSSFASQLKRVLARVDDLALLHYGGFLAHRPRNAVSLQALLEDYFELSARVQQFRGQWLLLEPSSLSRLSPEGGNNQLGVSLVAGDRVWDVTNKIRLRLGPLTYEQFVEFLPDRAPDEGRKAFFLLCHLVRLYIGPELDYDVQLVLRARDVPECRLTEGLGVGPRLGWNTWMTSLPMDHDAEEAAFEGDEATWLNSNPREAR
jgi:type VI secretion system protein ImpH